MRILHLLSSGSNGGIEILCKEYASFSKHENHFAFIWQGGSVYQSMKRKNCFVYSLYAKKYNLFALVMQLQHICKKNRIEIVVVHHADVFMRFVFIVLAKLNKNIRIAAYAHSNANSMVCIEQKWLSRCKKQVLAYSFLHATYRIAISKSVKDSLVDVFNLCPSAIEVIYNGVNIDRFAPVQLQCKQIPKIIFVGRVTKVKGIQNTIKALSLLPKELSYQFEVVGEGDYLPVLKKLVVKSNIEDKVVFVGNQNDIPDRLKNADVFVHVPECEEGFGITIVEAMATGLVCVCNKRGAIPEIITDGVNGLLVPNDDADALAQTLAYAIENVLNGSLNELKTNARKRAKNFSMETFTETLDALLCKL